jgi:hypothetical protein
MASKVPAARKKYFTIAEANAALPLVRAIAQDITELAHSLHDRHERLKRVRSGERAKMGESYQEELQHMEQEFERDQARMHEYEKELKDLGVELKDYYTGLLDFRCKMDNREVYLCWRLGEAEVAHWHELDAGFAGRQKLPRPEGKSPRSQAQSN